MTLPEPFEQELTDLTEDRTSGAMALGRHAAQLLKRAAESEDNEFRPLLGRLAAGLVRAQPSMAPLLHVVNHALLAADGPDGAAGVVARMENDLLLLAEAGRQYAREVALEIGLDATVVTLGHSATVEHVVTQAAEYGCRWRVVVALSEPGSEGRRLAERLAPTAHAVHLVPDSAAPNFLRDATLLLGADAISQRGLVNKVGTMGLAGLAHFLHRPVLVLANDYKLVPDTLEPLVALDPQAAEGLLPAPPEGVTQDMHLFDVTPLNWLTHTYTEFGVLTPDALRMQLLEWTVHPSLVEEAQRRR
jgi:translation initiation factor 2B subunit (eIF-2B alpha/beta/delta family)